MKNLLRVVLCVAMLGTLVAGVANAGLNAGGTARIYWLATTAATTPVASRNSAGTGMIIGLVTAKGITNFRGADVQLYVNAFDQSGLPAAWQAQTGGPAEGCWDVKIGGWKLGTSTIWPNIFTTAPAVVNPIAAQGGMIMYASTPCITAHNVGVVWFSDAGAAGVARTATREYGVFGFTLDFTIVPGLPGGPDPGPATPVCINPNWRLPCGSGEKGNVMVTVDNTTAKDYLPFEAGYQWLTYAAGVGTPGCPLSTPAKVSTWGKVRQLFR